MSDREVKGGGDVGESARTEMFEVGVRHTIWTNCRRVFDRANGFEGVFHPKRRESWIKPSLPDLSNDAASLLRGLMNANTRKLFVKSPRDGRMLSIDFVVLE